MKENQALGNNGQYWLFFRQNGEERRLLSTSCLAGTYDNLFQQALGIVHLHKLKFENTRQENVTDLWKNENTQLWIERRQLPITEPEALQICRDIMKQNGKNWKETLRAAWISGNYNTLKLKEGQAAKLQLIRNSFGPTWLNNARI